jgi:hypothetical protein
MSKPEWDNRSPIWGGATLGLIVGVILGFIYGNFTNILWAVLIGALLGFGADLLGKFGDKLKK